MSTGQPVPSAPDPAATPTPQTPQQRWAAPVPPSVAAQAAEAERLMREQNAPSPVTDGGAPADPSSSDGQPGQPGPPAPAPQAPAGDPVETWEQRARSAQGRWEAANAALQAQQERANDLEREIALLKAGGAAEPPPASRATELKLVTEEEEKDYGKDLLDVMGRRSREVFAPEFETLAQRLDRLEGRVAATGQVIQQNETRGVWETLSGEIPNWVEINHHPLFHQWLAQPERYTKKPKKDLLGEAFARHDSETVLTFFQDFLSEASGTPPSQQPAPAPSPAPNGNGNGGQPSLLDFAAPGRARSEPQPLPPGKPTYTRAQMQRFYEDVRRGAYKGREPEQAAIEADIFRAQHEGRIQ
jgi:hypothetical protein